MKEITFNTIATRVKESLGRQRKLKVVAVSLKQKDIQTELLRLANELDTIKENDKKLNKHLSNISKLFVKASINKSSVVKKLEEKLGILQLARENWLAAKHVQTRIARFSKNRAASNLRKEADSFVVITEQAMQKAEQTLSKIVKGYRPLQLSNKDPLLASIFKYVRTSFEEVEDKRKPIIDTNYSINNIDFGPKGEIKFARYIELESVPTMSGDRKTCYLVAVVTLKAHKTVRGKLLPIDQKSFSTLSLSLTTSVIPPNKIDNLYQVTSLVKAKEVLSYMSQKLGLVTLTGEPISSTPERRRLKVKEHLKLLNNEKIKIIQNKSFFIVKVPADLVPSNITFQAKDIKDVSLFEKELYMDMQRIAGIPVSSRFSSGRLKREKVEKKGKFYEFTYRLLPMRPDKDLLKESELGPKEDSKVISNDSREWLKTFREDLSLKNLENWGE